VGSFFLFEFSIAISSLYLQIEQFNNQPLNNNPLLDKQIIKKNSIQPNSSFPDEPVLNPNIHANVAKNGNANYIVNVKTHSFCLERCNSDVLNRE